MSLFFVPLLLMLVVKTKAAFTLLKKWLKYGILEWLLQNHKMRNDSLQVYSVKLKRPTYTYHPKIIVLVNQQQSTRSRTCITVALACNAFLNYVNTP